MGTKTAIIYSSVDGQTRKICKALEKLFREHERSVELFSIEDFNGEPKDYDKLVLGASIRYGVHNEKVIAFRNTRKEQLDSMKTAFFSVNLVARKPEKNRPDTNPYVIKFFKSIEWQPTIVEVFAGMLDYKKYPFFDRIMIQFIMWMTKGPTNSDAKIEYTDWNKVKEFGKRVMEM